MGINDTGYFYSSFGNILRAAELLGRTRSSPIRRRERLFDRIRLEITPDGGAVPYGASGGYHSAAGADLRPGTGRQAYPRRPLPLWRASPHELRPSPGLLQNHQHLQSLAMEEIALTSLICDDSVAAVEPEAGTTLFTRKEILRLTNAEVKQRFPKAGGVDCNMYMSQTVMPHKLVFRFGWKPGDLYMLMDCYPRHDPLNPTAILGMERYSASFAEMTSEKFISRENAVHITDLAGGATYLGKKDYHGPKQLPLGWAGMECEVPSLADRPLASHARLRVGHYMGYEATHEREVLFVKNRFVLFCATRRSFMTPSEPRSVRCGTRSRSAGPAARTG